MEHLQALGGGVAVLAICVLLFIEESGVPMPFSPGDIVLVTGGSLAAMHSTQLWIVMPVAYLSCVLGAMSCYLLSRRAGRPLVLIIGRRAGVTEERLRRAEARLLKAGSRAVFIARVAPGMRIYASIASGCLRLPARAFITGLLPGLALWLTWCTLLGYFLGSSVGIVLRVWDRAMVVSTAVVVLTLAFRWFVRRRRGRGRAPVQQPVAIPLIAA